MDQEAQTEDKPKAITEPGLEIQINIADCLKVIEQQQAQLAGLRLENTALVRLVTEGTPQGKEGKQVDGTTPA